MGKQRRVVWSPAARQDLLEIWAHFARVASPEIAVKLLHEIDYAAERLADVDPRMYRVRNDLMPELPGGLRSAPVHPYAIFYRMTPLNSAENRRRGNYPRTSPKSRSHSTIGRGHSIGVNGS